MNHLSGEMLKSLAGINDLPHVPYRGAGPAMADVIGGQIPIFIPAMTSQVLEFHRAGKLRLLAITNPIRLPIAPEIPTAVEAGVPGLVTPQVLGIFSPAGDAERCLRECCRGQPRRARGRNLPAVAHQCRRRSDTGLDAGQKFNDFMVEEVKRWRPLVNTIGVKLD